MNYQLQQEQRAELIMTWELQQAIHLLQYSTMELYSHIHQQLAENPILEIEDHSWNKDNVWQKGHFESLEQKQSLRDTCREQLVDFQLDQTLKFFCNYIIDNLDEKGYLSLDVKEICPSNGPMRCKWDKALTIIQSMEPTGVGARSLKECIALQLRRQGATDLAETMVEYFLDEVSQRNAKKIAASLGVSVCEVEEAICAIRKCDPRPGSQYFHEIPQYIYPDVIVNEIEGTHFIYLNEAMLPPLTMNQKYRELLNQDKIRHWYQSASWLIRGMEQRRHTLHRVVQHIVIKQQSFLEKGIEYLKPLTLLEIASALDLHESTVSRATQNKYIQTPRGTFALRYFFSSGIGNKWSSRYVKHRIKEIITLEDKSKPYSDQKIVDLLHIERIDLSRRTVAKYREELGILPSKLRRFYTK